MSVVCIQFIKCSGTAVKEDKGYGKLFFYQNCAICHMQKYDGIDKSPGLLTLNSYDSLTLFNKMKGIKQDSIHEVILQSVDYSEKQIKSVCKFIKSYYDLSE